MFRGLFIFICPKAEVFIGYQHKVLTSTWALLRREFAAARDFETVGCAIVFHGNPSSKFAKDWAVFEQVSRTTASEQDVFMFGMPVDDKMCVGR